MNVRIAEAETFVTFAINTKSLAEAVLNANNVSSVMKTSKS